MHFSRALTLATAIAAPAASLAPLHQGLESAASFVPGKFIVKVKDTVNASAAHEIESLMYNVDYVYNVTSFKGFAGGIKKAALESVRAHPDVVYVERDQVASIAFFESQDEVLPGLNTLEVNRADYGQVSSDGNYAVQYGAPWSLGRISHRGSENFTDNTTYVYEKSAGEGVCAYILDTGIRIDHEEFEGRAERLADFAGGGSEGHGTSVASALGGATCGVAKKVKLYSVQVMAQDDGCNTGNATCRRNKIRRIDGRLSNLLAGLVFVAADIQTRNCPNGIVVNTSWSSGFQHAFNELAGALVDAGVFFAAAAGNDYKPIGNKTPQAEPRLCAVGATDRYNRMSKFSSHGPLVDILAPGEHVLVASSNSTTALTHSDGTSFAAPYVAGLAACLLASEHRDSKTLCEQLVEMACPLIIQHRNDTVNRVAFNGNPLG